jgi:putative ABC transport system ATP-binding protein
MKIAISERTEPSEIQLAKLAIETRKLRKVYGEGNTEVIAMQDASVSVRQGEVVALLGPSGSGKSTFLTAIGLINPPTSGQIWIGGELVMDGPDSQTDVRAFRRKHIGFVFQKSNLIDFLNARENVQNGAQRLIASSGWQTCPRSAGFTRGR